MAQDHGLCRKKVKEKSQTVHGLPLQARVAAANRTVRTTPDDPGAHGMNRGQSKAKLNGGKKDEMGSGHGMAKASRHT